MRRVSRRLLAGAALVALVAMGCGQKAAATATVTLADAPQPVPAESGPSAGPSAAVAAAPETTVAVTQEPTPPAHATSDVARATSRVDPPEPTPEAAAAPRRATGRDNQDYGRLFWGRGFSSVSVREEGQERQLVDGTRIELAFERRRPVGAARWRADCNRLGGDVTVTERRLLISDVHGTAMGCSDELHEQDDWIAAFFDADPAWTFDGRHLRLTADGVVIDFEESSYW